ncbi:hypothetical protein HOU00_gp387 [Caulobacter phage CcrPW]|uniref:Uncharacterized protein n=1 Tax=Caulobacter phage CcrPW TaxID=2283271 RepID=A0A385EDC6_9CAUD|nr:hypothetical protein HOU00_gp387 [Caulobacter phage CcrPW]AXQ68738.1 hypothetical protein CcrPW_gp199c [Caulobacter phage CcrPW]
MIDPTDVIKFDRSDAELEEFWLFCTVVAGKTAATQARLLENFIRSLPPYERPFDAMARSWTDGELMERLQASRLGQYSRLHRCFVESLKLDLRSDPLEAFEAIHGVGPKTARMFLMHSRPDQRLAAIDTHVLKHLRANGVEAPLVTPGSAREYRRLELEFLTLADAAGQTPSDYDLAVWKSYQRLPAAA